MRKIIDYRTVFIVNVCIGTILGSQMILFVVHQLWDINAGWNVLQYCLNIVEGFIQAPIAASLLVDLFIAYTFARICLRLTKQWMHHNRWMNQVQLAENRSLTEQFARLLQADNLIVMNDEKPFALVFGLFTPRIAISTAMIASLTEKELKAVYSHELYHSERFHPLKMFILTVLAEAFSYLPLFRQTLHYYKCWTEIEADRYAVQTTGDVESLGSALLKMIRLYQGKDYSVSTVHFADYAVNYRIKCILKPEEPVRIPVLSVNAFMVSSIGILVLTSWMIGGCL